MSRRSEPFEPKDLKDCASPSAVARVWGRLEEGLGEQRLTPRHPTAWVWGAAAASVAFAAGIWVGDGANKPELARTTRVHAEPWLDMEPASVQAPIVPLAATRESVGERAVANAAPRRAARTRSLTGESGEKVSSPVLLSPSAISAEHAPAPVVEREPLPQWQRLANGGEYEAALFELGQAGGFESALSIASAEQLMLLVDVARATRQQQRALAALRRVVSQFPGEPVAPLAAWSLANLLEKAGDAAGAAEAFAAYRALSPQGDFAEDALVRQLQSAVNQSDRDSAARLLAQYESEFPEARRADEVSRLRERLLGGDLAGVDAGAEPQGDLGGSVPTANHDDSTPPNLAD